MAGSRAYRTVKTLPITPEQRDLPYEAERTPEIFLFDKGGTMRYHGTVDDNYDDPTAVRNHYLTDALEAVLGCREPATTQTAAVGCTMKWK